jgi:hypothetical protein
MDVLFYQTKVHIILLKVLHRIVMVARKLYWVKMKTPININNMCKTECFFWIKHEIL